MSPRTPNQDIEQPTLDQPGSLTENPADNSAERKSRADQEMLDVDNQDQGGDQDIDTAGIPDVDPESRNNPID